MPVQWTDARDKLVLLTYVFGSAQEKQAVANMIGCTPKALSLRRGHYKQQYNQLRSQLAVDGSGSGSSSPTTPTKRRRTNTASSKGKQAADENSAQSAACKRKLTHYEDMQPEFPDYANRSAIGFDAVKSEVKSEYMEDLDSFFWNQPIVKQEPYTGYDDYQPGFTPPPSTPARGFSRANRAAPIAGPGGDVYEDDDEGDLDCPN